MDTATIRIQPGHDSTRLRDNASVLVVFVAALFLSALLMFSVQPAFAKMVLPKLGGTPSVWAISMCFFQAALLLGYCYAHLVNRLVPLSLAPIVHLGLLATALMALPFGLPAGIEPPPGDAYLWLLGVLTWGVGLPVLAISATAPLLQAWFARTGHPHAGDPYFLYGASNLGSLVALLAYPVAIEPVWGLIAQSRIWTGGFVLLTVLIGLAGVQMVVCSRTVPATAQPGPATDSATGPWSFAQPTWNARLQWIGLAFVPSGLLVAFSNYFATDIASAPFIWVIPLAMFLATFIIVFCDKPAVPHWLMLMLQPAIVAQTFVGLMIPGTVGWMIVSVTGVVAFFVTTMVAHRELYERRPAASHLTEYYLWMSLGGVLGGVFAAIIAPQIFNALYELPILLVLGLACRPRTNPAAAGRDERMAAAAIAIGGLAVLLCLATAIDMGVVPKSRSAVASLMPILAISILMLLARERTLCLLAAAAVAALGLIALPSSLNLGQSMRSFFGVHRILVENLIEADGRNDGQIRMLLHGTTMHGVERIRTADGQLVTGAPTPATYYHPDSPMFHALDAARRVSTPDAGHQFSVGIVGLGAGSMACHAKAGEHWRIFEIDPVVVQIAREKFSYLSHCLPDADIVVGDARLTLAKEPSGRFDYILIDAFSSNSIPVHLMTRAALQLYLDKLTPNGVLALHISNRHLDLTGVTDALVASLPGLKAVTVSDRRKATIDKGQSQIVAISRSADALAPVLTLEGAVPTAPTDAAPWTDDYSNILPALLRHYWR